MKNLTRYYERLKNRYAPRYSWRVCIFVFGMLVGFCLVTAVQVVLLEEGREELQYHADTILHHTLIMQNQRAIYLLTEIEVSRLP